MKGEHSDKVESSFWLLQNVPSCAELPEEWESEMSLKAMKLVCKRTNSPSSWQRIRNKAQLSNLLKDKVYEHSQFVKSIRLKTFQEYLNMGLDNLSPSFKRRPRQRRKIEKARLLDSKKRSIEFTMTEALASAVHIIPSGSGVHIGNGLVLTCAHCVTHDDCDDDDVISDKVGCIAELVTAHGRQVGAVCTKLDNDVDLALLQIPPCIQPALKLASITLALSGSDVDGQRIFALGNPCDIDLETDLETPRGNGFFPFNVSEGCLESKISPKKSKAEGLGRQIHSAWTYWGHSGCPLIALHEMEPFICGIHNSWDERNGNRHAISLDEIRKFLKDYD